LLCSVGALGLYLFWRWHVRGESTPNFRSHSSWYPVKLLAGRDDGTGTQELGYKSQYEATWRAFVLAGISSVQKTHVMRGCGARAAEVHGVSEKQVSYEWIIRSSMVMVYDIVGGRREWKWN
jgi:centromere DNA-binding complex CBF3 subunit-like protein